ncbi:MAG: hypothetical protein HYS83_00660 [Candidatus Blackburnbacteria bacterium]|nr:hypothetical protein [Candidatus Blackburnbacteria bacterium]
MIELPHTIVGAAIAVKVGNPALALPLALASHFVLDPIPHWNPHLYTELKKDGRVSKNSKLFMVGDVLLSLAAGLFIAFQMLPNIALFITVILGAFVAVFPDVIKAPFYLFGVKNPLLVRYVNAERSIQGETNIPAFGLFTQLLVVVAGFWWALS